MSPDIDHYARFVAERMRWGRVVPFLGAGVNLADRPGGVSWRSGVDLPSGGELAETLAVKYGYPRSEPRGDLMRVSQFVESMVGETAIYDELRHVFTGTYEPTVVHKVLARVPSILEEKGVEHPNLLVVTTNYDDAQEKAFDEAGVEYDVLWYMARGDHRRQFIHQAPGQDPTAVNDPARSPLSLERRSVVLKIHGATYRADVEFDSYVVTEDHYIEYMSGTDLAAAVPVKLMDTMVEAHFLFLGYRLGDWNLRVFLHALWAARSKTATSWSVNREHRELDRLFWSKRSVEMVEAPLSDYMGSLEEALRGL
jgi:SIR2-like domain